MGNDAFVPEDVILDNDQVGENGYSDGIMRLIIVHPVNIEWG